MKIFALSSVLTISAVASAAFVPQTMRLRRDVSELAETAEYLPPATEYLAPDTTEAAMAAALEQTEPESAVLGNAGYEYRTVRRLKFRHRNRRDVSHLPRQYLPPSKAYLPPPVADDTEEVIAAVEPKLAREYLPPAEVQVSTQAPEVVETEAPATEAVPEEQPEPEVQEQEQPDVRVLDVPQTTAELLDDGYHYKQPTVAYLPPADTVDKVEGPVGGESAVLTKDGYQYRAVRRYRF